jgi:hypothetical protein
MLLFPEVQAKAQREIDAVVGPDRLPSMEDEPKLEYVNRVIQEIMRWRPVVPLGAFHVGVYQSAAKSLVHFHQGLPHACYQDDVYKGYRIPKGAIVSVIGYGKS